MKNCKKTWIFCDIFFPFRHFFSSFFNFGAILAQELNSFICKKKFWFFGIVWVPEGTSIVERNLFESKRPLCILCTVLYYTVNKLHEAQQCKNFDFLTYCLRSTIYFGTLFWMPVQIISYSDNVSCLHLFTFCHLSGVALDMPLPMSLLCWCRLW